MNEPTPVEQDVPEETAEIAPVESRSSTEQIDLVVHAIAEEDDTAVQTLFESLDGSEIARVFESVPDNLRLALWKSVPEALKGDVLVELGDVAKVSLVTALEQGEVVRAVERLESHDLAEVVDALPDQIVEAIRESLDYRGLQGLDAALAFEEDSAGRIMETAALAIRSDISLETVLRFLRNQHALPEHTPALMVIDRQGIFLGELPLSALLTNEPSTAVEDVMDKDALSISPEMSQRALSLLFLEHELVSVPVVDRDNRLIGRVTLDYMVDVINDEADHQILGAVGLDEDEDLFSPILPSAKRRLFWLGINLLTAFLAAWVIGLFEATLQKVVALAVLMPIVASMGGIAGSQTLTLMIRGLATGKISGSNARWLAWKEIAISLISGVIWSIVVGIVSWLWFNDIRISLILGAAMVVNLATAAVSGFAIPMIMKRLGIDPALAGGVVLTTATDVVGFVSFLGLASLFLV